MDSESSRPGAINVAIVVGGLLASAVLAGALDQGGNGIVFTLFLVAALPTYFAPAIIGAYYGHPSATPIGVLNLFLGWTVVGWVVALVWAFMWPTPIPSDDDVTCPFCAERIKAQAIKCKHCGTDLKASAPG
jgi:hypothetical protein